MKTATESTSFVSWDPADDSGDPGTLMVKCACCGKESPLSLVRGEPRNPPWLRSEARKAGFFKKAGEENLASAEELAAEEAVKPLRAAYTEAVARRDRVSAILAKASGEVVQDARTIEPRAIGRNQRLFEEKETLLRQAKQEIDQAALELEKASARYEQLHRRRIRRIYERADELEQADARARNGNGHKQPAAWNQIDWSARLREVVGDPAPAAKG